MADAKRGWTARPERGYWTWSNGRGLIIDINLGHWSLPLAVHREPVLRFWYVHVLCIGIEFP